MNDSPQGAVPLSHALGTRTSGQLERSQPSLKVLASRVLEDVRDSVPLSHVIGDGTLGQAIADRAKPKSNETAAWDAEDWRVHFDERAGIAEHGAGLSRTVAETRAYECCINEWMNRNPPTQRDADLCIHCEKWMPENEAIPVLTGGGGHVWLHHTCHAPWMAKRRTEAAAALVAFGFQSQVEY